MKIKVNKKAVGLVAAAWVLAFSYTGTAFAHVVVKPSDAKTGAYQTFMVSVPTEKDNPTVKVKLEVPASLIYVTPTVKSGWTIQAEKNGEGESAKVRTITWSGGKIDPGYRDDFTFSAKTPDKPTDLQWKAYQTYQDGTVVAWDQQQGNSKDDDSEEAKNGPFSVTKVMAETDQERALKTVGDKTDSAQSTADRAWLMGIAALALAVVALLVAIVRKTKAKNQDQTLG